MRTLYPCVPTLKHFDSKEPWQKESYSQKQFFSYIVFSWIPVLLLILVNFQDDLEGNEKDYKTPSSLPFLPKAACSQFPAFLLWGLTPELSRAKGSPSLTNTHSILKQRKILPKAQEPEHLGTYLLRTQGSGSRETRVCVPA